MFFLYASLAGPLGRVVQAGHSTRVPGWGVTKIHTQQAVGPMGLSYTERKYFFKICTQVLYGIVGALVLAPGT